MNMFHGASLKLRIDRAVLAYERQNTEDGGSIDGTSKNKSKSKSKWEMQAKDIDELLNKEAYYVFRDENDTEVQQFIETDIDQLL